MIGTIKKGAGKAVDAATGATVGAAGIYLRGKIHEAGEENTGIEAAERTEYLIEQGVEASTGEQNLYLQRTGNVKSIPAQGISSGKSACISDR